MTTEAARTCIATRTGRYLTLQEAMELSRDKDVVWAIGHSGPNMTLPEAMKDAEVGDVIGAYRRQAQPSPEDLAQDLVDLVTDQAGDNLWDWSCIMQGEDVDGNVLARSTIFKDGLTRACEDALKYHYGHGREPYWDTGEALEATSMVLEAWDSMLAPLPTLTQEMADQLEREGFPEIAALLHEGRWDEAGTLAFSTDYEIAQEAVRDSKAIKPNILTRGLVFVLTGAHKTRDAYTVEVLKQSWAALKQHISSPTQTPPPQKPI